MVRIFSSYCRVLLSADLFHLPQSVNQPTSALPFFLRALHASSLRGTGSSRLLTVCHLINCRITLSPTATEAERSLRELDGIWNEVLAIGKAEDQEVLARAREVKGTVLILLGEGRG